MAPTSESTVLLASHTTLRVGGPAGRFEEAHGPEELRRLACACDDAGDALFVLGGGSNVLVADKGFDGWVVHTVDGSIEALPAPDASGRTVVRVEAGTDWDDVVAWAVDHALAGIEALSGIPGQIGSAVMQNLGAYGQDVGGVLAAATLLDRADGSVRRWHADELGLGYRTSMLRASMEQVGSPWTPSPRWIVLEAYLALSASESGTVDHPQLARALGCEVGVEIPIRQIRSAVLEVRSAKGMVRDDEPQGQSPVYDRWSSGSFFTNPVLSTETADELLPQDAPRYATDDPATVKTSAAWLIEHAGFPKGYGVDGPGSHATLSSLHTLALTNRGDASAADIVRLARTVRDGVRERFGIELEPESVLVGVEL